MTYLLYAMVVPPLAGLLAATQPWFADLQPWVDFAGAHTVLFDGQPTGEQWAHLATATALWVMVPLALGLALVRRAEVHIERRAGLTDVPWTEPQSQR